MPTTHLARLNDSSPHRVCRCLPPRAVQGQTSENNTREKRIVLIWPVPGPIANSHSGYHPPPVDSGMPLIWHRFWFITAVRNPDSSCGKVTKTDAPATVFVWYSGTKEGRNCAIRSPIFHPVSPSRGVLSPAGSDANRLRVESPDRDATHSPA